MNVVAGRVRIHAVQVVRRRTRSTAARYTCGGVTVIKSFQINVEKKAGAKGALQSTVLPLADGQPSLSLLHRPRRHGQASIAEWRARLHKGGKLLANIVSSSAGVKYETLVLGEKGGDGQLGTGLKMTFAPLCVCNRFPRSWLYHMRHGGKAK